MLNGVFEALQCPANSTAATSYCLDSNNYPKNLDSQEHTLKVATSREQWIGTIAIATQASERSHSSSGIRQ